MLYKYVILNWPIKKPFFRNYVNYYECLLLNIITLAKLKFIGDVHELITKEINYIFLSCSQEQLSSFQKVKFQ